MNERSLLLGLLLPLLLQPALAAGAVGLHAPDFKIEQRPSASGKLDVRALAPSGHHFNLKAPMYFEWLGAGGSAPVRLHPLHKSSLTLVFEVPAQNSTRDFEISAYLCDNKETYCERHTVRQSAPPSVASKKETTPGEPKVASGAESSPSGPATRANPLLSRDMRGFVLNDAQTAFRRARKRHQLVMIDFFAIWCPPCNELDEHVFSAPGFLAKTSDFVRLKLDVDSPVSWRWKAKYAIQGYPTIIFATPEGEELGRIVGFRPLATFLSDARRVSANREATYSTLRSRADSGDRAAAAKLGLLEYDRANWADAKKYLLLSGDTKLYGEQIADSEIGLLEDKLASPNSVAPNSGSSDALNAQLVEALAKSIRDYPDTPDSLDRRMRLAEIYGDRKDNENRKKILASVVETAQFLMKNPDRLENKDCTAGDLWETIGEAYEDAGDPAHAHLAYQNGAREYRSLMKSDSERGYGLELAYCLWKSGDVPTATALYRKFEKLYPDEFTFFFNHARMDHDLHRNSEARKLAAAAYSRSYGDNKLRCGKLLADILEAQGEKDHALAMARKTLAEVKLPRNSSLRAHRYARQLQDMIARLRHS